MSLAEQFRIGHWLADILGIDTAAKKAAATVFLLDLLEAAETATETQF